MKSNFHENPKPTVLRALFRIRDNIHYREHTDLQIFAHNCQKQLLKYYCNWKESESKISMLWKSIREFFPKRQFQLP